MVHQNVAPNMNELYRTFSHITRSPPSWTIWRSRQNKANFNIIRVREVTNYSVLKIMCNRSFQEYIKVKKEVLCESIRTTVFTIALPFTLIRQ